MSGNSDAIKVLIKKRDEYYAQGNALDAVIKTMMLESGELPFGYYLNSQMMPTTVQDALSVNGKELVKPVSAKYSKYNKQETFKERVASVIRMENRFIHVREIARIIHSLEPDIPESVLIKKISPALTVLKAAKGSNLINIVVGKSNLNSFWGSRSWLDESGNPKKEHMYNEDELSGTKESILI